jgi:hypothetical protein
LTTAYQQKTKKGKLGMRQLVKKSQSVAFAVVLALGGVVSGINGGSVAFAASTLTWTGAGGDGKFSTATNWSTGVAPVNGDSIVFDNTSLTGQQAVNDDISSLSLASIQFSGSSPQYYTYTIDGNTLTVAGTNGGVGTIKNNLLLASDTTINKTFLGDAASPASLDTAGHSLTIASSDVCGGSIGSALIGSGAVVVNTAGDQGYNFTAASPSYTGQISVTGGAAGFSTVSALGNASGLAINGGAAVVGLNGASRTLSVPVSIGGAGTQYLTPLRAVRDQGAAVGCSGGGGGATDMLTLTLAGGLSLTSDAQYSGAYVNTVVSNPYNANGHALTTKSSSIGTITLPDNTVVAPQSTTTTYSANAPAQDILVNPNETAIVSGTYRSVFVNDRGTLKGTGFMDSLYASNGATVAPGNSPGTLTVANALTLDTGSTLNEELQNTSAYDKIVATNGPVTINDATLNTTLYTGYDIKAGDKFTIIDNQAAGAVTGTFSGLAEGAQFTVDGITFSITYTGGTGNDVVLTALTAGSAPSAPNTGFKLQMKNPFVALALGLSSVAILAVFVRKNSKQ